MARSEASTQRERRRARSSRRLTYSDDCETGHPAMFGVAPVVELGRQPEGGGYPVGLIEFAAKAMGVRDLDQVVHLCSGSVQARLTVDYRAAVGARVRADVRWLPFRPGSLRFVMADPPYGPDYAGALWPGLEKRYPTPTVLLSECAQALGAGGMVALLHHLVPPAVPPLERVAVYGITTGPGFRIRALTILRKPAQLTLEEASCG